MHSTLQVIKPYLESRGIIFKFVPNTEDGLYYVNNDLKHNGVLKMKNDTTVIGPQGLAFDLYEPGSIERLAFFIRWFHAWDDDYDRFRAVMDFWVGWGYPLTFKNA